MKHLYLILVLALLMISCVKRPTLTAEECIKICRDAIDTREEINNRDCQNAIEVALATRESQQKDHGSNRLCDVVTPDDCAHDVDLCSKVGQRLCYDDSRSDCEHDIDLCSEK